MFKTELIMSGMTDFTRTKGSDRCHYLSIYLSIYLTPGHAYDICDIAEPSLGTLNNQSGESIAG